MLSRIRITCLNAKTLSLNRRSILTPYYYYAARQNEKVFLIFRSSLKKKLRTYEKTLKT
jgi:hypothetical protein